VAVASIDGVLLYEVALGNILGNLVVFVGNWVGAVENKFDGDVDATTDGLRDSEGNQLGDVLANFDGILVGGSLSVSLGLKEGLLVGIALGSELDNFDGVIVGILLSTALGVKEGILLGLVLGDILGSFDGVIVGISLSAALGLKEGILLGLVLGNILGNSDGVVVGYSDGYSDGFIDANIVGSPEIATDGFPEIFSEGCTVDKTVGTSLKVGDKLGS